MVSENCLSISCSKRGKTVVVVGACSSIGDALIPELLDKYSSMVLTESPQNFESLVGKYGEKPNVKLLEMDVLNKSRINVLVSALETTEEIWDRIIDVNLKGFFFVSKVIAKNMILNGGGSILGIASQHAVVANVDRAAYCASKAGMIHLAKELALEWAKYGIRVNMVSPTMIFSEKNKEILDGNRAKKEYLIKIPLRKYAVPEDVSSAILFLNSDKASMITGQNLIVDGGWTIY